MIHGSAKVTTSRLAFGRSFQSPGGGKPKYAIILDMIASASDLQDYLNRYKSAEGNFRAIFMELVRLLIYRGDGLAG